MITPLAARGEKKDNGEEIKDLPGCDSHRESIALGQEQKRVSSDLCGLISELSSLCLGSNLISHRGDAKLKPVKLLQ